MKKQLMLLLCCSAGQLTAQDILWEKSYGGDKAEYLFDIQPTADYGFILAGSSLSQKSGNKSESAYGNLDYWIWKMDEKGEPEWQKSFGGSGMDLLRSIKNTSDGGFILGGTSNSPKGDHKKEACRGGNDLWIIKLNATGVEEWQFTYGGIGQDDFVTVKPTKDGGYIVGGSSDSKEVAPGGFADNEHPNDKTAKKQGGMDYWILKLDKDGKIVWQKSYGGTQADLLRCLIPTSDGGFLAGGWSNSHQNGDKSNVNYGTGGDFWVLKLDKDGEIEWQQVIGGDKDDQLYDMIQTKDKGYILGGSSNSGASNSKNSSASGTDFWIVKLDEQGLTNWQQSFHFGAIDVLTSLVENPDGTIMIGGHAQSNPDGKNETGINDFIALKISDSGERLWEKSVGSDGEDIMKKAIMTRDGGFVLAGTSNPEKKGGRKKENKKKDKTSVSFGNGGHIAAVDKAQKLVDDTLQNGAKKVNEFVENKVSAATDELNKKLNPNKDSRFKVGVNGPTGDLLKLAKGGGNSLDAAGGLLSGLGGPKGNGRASRDKKLNFGKSDFWVVKLRDKDKTITEVKTIEAFPNPATQYVNIIVGFEYTKGTIAVYSLAGNEMQRFSITGRTIPVNVSKYPQGIYIVSVTTNNGDAAIKIIKN